MEKATRIQFLEKNEVHFEKEKPFVRHVQMISNVSALQGKNVSHFSFWRSLEVIKHRFQLKLSAKYLKFYAFMFPWCKEQIDDPEAYIKNRVVHDAIRNSTYVHKGLSSSGGPYVTPVFLRGAWHSSSTAGLLDIELIVCFGGLLLIGPDAVQHLNLLRTRPTRFSTIPPHSSGTLKDTLFKIIKTGLIYWNQA